MPLLDPLPTIPSCHSGLDACVTARAVHASPLVQVADWRCRHDGPALRAERHHTSWVLSVVRRGACRIHQGRWSATLDPATTVLHSPGVGYRTSHPFGCIDAGWSAAVDRSLGEEIVEREGGRTPRAGRPLVVVRPGSRWFGHLVDLRRADRMPDPLFVEEWVVEAFAAMVRRSSTPRREDVTGRAHEALVDDARSWLNARFRDDVNLTDLSLDIGASPAHLCRVFRARTGMTLRRYLLRLRLAHVIDGMEPGTSLSALAVDAGFYSHSHLCSRFRRELGMSPGELRSLLECRGSAN